MLVPTRPTGRFIGGDPLRGLAALGVLIGHVAIVAVLVSSHLSNVDAITTGQVIDAYGVAGTVAMIAIKGVWLFFVLSGYLIARPFVRAYCTATPSPDAGRYVRHRLLRIVPAFWVVVVATAVLLGTRHTGVAGFLAVPLFAQNYAPSGFAGEISQAWTLGSEMTFYALVPVAAALAAVGAGRISLARRPMWVLAAATGIFFVSLLCPLVIGRASADLRSAPAILCAFMPGVALAAAEQFVPAWARGRRSARSAAVLLGLVGAGLFAVAGMPGTPAGSGRPLVILSSGMIVAAVLLAQWADGDCWRILDNRGTRWLGERSYGIYLVHWLVIELVFSHLTGGSRWAVLAGLLGATLLASLVASDLLYRFVERPCLNLRRRWDSPALRPAPAPPASAPARPAESIRATT